MLRLESLQHGERVLFALSGRIEGEDLAHLESVLKAEAKNNALDLKEVSLVSREAVRFLAICEEQGTALRNCPAYIREWIARERSEL